MKCPHHHQPSVASLALAVLLGLLITCSRGSHDANRLYDDLLRKGGYNKLVRPLGNKTDTITVEIGLRLTQIVDVDEKNQIMTTKVWLDQQWYDYKLLWDPNEYGGIKGLYVASDELWLPDIVLFNNADGNFTVTSMAKAQVYYNGLVTWKPPAVFKSLCPINVKFFPFDEQSCTLKFASWTYDGNAVNIKHIYQDIIGNDLDIIPHGIDLSGYYRSTEWDLLEVPAKKFEKYYPCCSEPYPDLKFNVTIRRKTLFYTVNLLIPCLAICSVTLLVFYLPAQSGEKITLGIIILIALNIFLLLVAEVTPQTSLATPLIGKYILFTMVLVTCSIVVTVFVLNVHFRSPSTHVMSPWIRKLFLNVLPRLLLMRTPRLAVREGVETRDSSGDSQDRDPTTQPGGSQPTDDRVGDPELTYRGRNSTLPPSLMEAVEGVTFIADRFRHQDQCCKQVKQDWQFLAMVLDRLFLWIFSAVFIVGTFGILLQAPTLYAKRQPIIMRP